MLPSINLIILLRSALSSPLGGAMTGALLVAAVELVSLGGAVRLDLALTVVSLHAALGMALGFLFWFAETLAERLHLSIPVASFLRALPALSPLVWLGRTLFQGASASALPGASSAPFWVPVLGILFIAAAVAIGSWLLSPPTGSRAALVGSACLVFAIVIEAANRRLYPTEYADLHVFLIPVSVVAVAAAVRSACAGRRRHRDADAAVDTVAWAATGTAVLVGVGLSLMVGLDDAEGRWVVATRGNHARHLVRVARDRLDLDRDGFSRALGGGDCDDGDPEINPGASELPANRIDEDCDGQDAEPVAVDPGSSERAEALEAFRSSPARRELLRRAASWNVLLLSVDSLRADMVADTPANRKAFPHLFALFDRSRRFDRAFAPGSGTDVSVASVMTGLVDPFRPVRTTLFEAVRRGGRSVRAVLPREVLRYAGKNLLTRGLDQVDVVVNDDLERDVSTYTTSSLTTERGLAALDQLASAGRPFLLWLHYFDVHEHLQIRPGDPDLAATGLRAGTRADKYRALVAVVDREIGKVMADIERRGLADRTAVVFFSDHGESLGEDVRLPDNHGLYLYQPLVHVPLGLHLPGGRSGPSDEPVSLLDLTPTLLDLLDIEPWRDLGGRSLLPHLVAGAPPALLHERRALPLNESEQWGIVLWPHKLLVRPRDNLVELYDLARDPREREDRAAERPDLVRKLKSLYRKFPRVRLDRSRKGRETRDRQWLPPRPR